MDISASYGDAFDVVAEVSIKQNPSTWDFKKQLDQAIEHAKLSAEYVKDVPTCALEINNANIDPDKEYLEFYLDAANSALIAMRPAVWSKFTCRPKTNRESLSTPQHTHRRSPPTSRIFNSIVADLRLLPVVMAECLVLSKR